MANYQIPKRTGLLFVPFLLPPLWWLFCEMRWSPERVVSGVKLLYWATESATLPWAFFTSVLLLLVIYAGIENKTKRNFLTVSALFFLAMMVGQGIKSTVKEYTQESRPFVLWIEEQYQIDDLYFYSVPKLSRQEIIESVIARNQAVPSWLIRHWQKETGYSFPSGHTLFATTWAWLALLFLPFRKYGVVTTVIIGWALLIEVSRLYLGMHRPVDLITSVLLSAVIGTIAHYFACRWQVLTCQHK